MYYVHLIDIIFIESISVNRINCNAGLLHKSMNSIELDVYVPSYRLAFEYQGMYSSLVFIHWNEGIQHFRIVYNQDNKELQDQLSRDQEKRILCEKAGITLIEVPYWWDEQEGEL